ncbi:hypothetical protein AYO21_02980 [Fonsecaea monophora]|uniref:FAD dependent oxidoreductase domain-containing protein n=1 Tax=Fonsecaea monophora TaxID=254056 RepID=A0A177FEW2_9EURO|nr:hypothetical protein AYO21_02980 [Fonsecaea monophora]OAG42697.1 hypothetical protein AYO21_02980 [Fonsecaea monophora]
MPSSTSKDDRILILGAGAFGLATAYSLALAGYTSVTVLDKHDDLPSRFSAGFDLNKIIRAEYLDPFYTKLALDAIRKWQTDPLYKPYYREVGYLNVVSGSAPPVIRDALHKYASSIEKVPAFSGKITMVDGSVSIKAIEPRFSGPVEGWKGYVNRLAGYAHSANAMEAVYRACMAKGVAFYLGPVVGEVQNLVHAPGSHSKVTGCRTRGGIIYEADLIIVALGANVAQILPSISSQVTASCWGVTHIQLSPDEATKLEGIPVTNVRDIGFFFEPDPATNKLKLCHMGGGYTNYGNTPPGQSVSLPYQTLEESRFIPDEDERQIRRLLREALPELADRPLVDNHLCWFADTPDSDYIIDFVPDTGKSLVVLSGDAGHGFKMLPIFGDFVRGLLEAGEQRLQKWKWKIPQQQNGIAQQVAWRASKSRELGAIQSRL